MTGFIIFCVVIGLAIWLLKGFDKIAGRRPKQVKNGINQATREGRIPCPQCAESILPNSTIGPK